MRGVQIEVTLDSHGFAGRGDICLFGEMLSRFFALYTDIYLFNRLIIILQPTGERLEWEEAQPPHSRLTRDWRPTCRGSILPLLPASGKTASRPTADGEPAIRLTIRCVFTRIREWDFRQRTESRGIR